MTDPLGTELYSRPLPSPAGVTVWAINQGNHDKSFILSLFGLKLIVFLHPILRGLILNLCLKFSKLFSKLTTHWIESKYFYKNFKWYFSFYVQNMFRNHLMVSRVIFNGSVHCLNVSV